MQARPVLGCVGGSYSLETVQLFCGWSGSPTASSPSVVRMLGKGIQLKRGCSDLPYSAFIDSSVGVEQKSTAVPTGKRWRSSQSRGEYSLHSREVSAHYSLLIAGENRFFWQNTSFCLILLYFSMYKTIFV